jgi:murein DD-endopeptidase MepM/ murein hydrolase activator NlpD
MRSYEHDGLRNEDWFGWGADVLSPCTGKVEKVRENRITNEPGIMGKPPASSVTVNCDDGVRFVVAHVASPVVAVGDAVKAGQKIAQVGNNGMSRHPHIHLGAWRGEEALQIRFDQTRMPIH